MGEVMMLLWLAAMLWLVISPVRKAVRDRKVRRTAKERGVYYGGDGKGVAGGAFFGGAALGGGGFDGGGGGGGGCDGGGGGGC